jgi:hypothetical protein
MRELADRVHALGPRPLFELFCEIASDGERLTRIEKYAALDPDFIRRFNGDAFPNNNNNAFYSGQRK